MTLTDGRQPMTRTRSRLWRPAVAVMVAATLLPSCAWLRPQATFVKAAAVPPSFTATGTVAAPERWWTAFGDGALDGLVAQALSGNLGLLAAWDRLAQSEAIARRAGADLVPHLDGQGTASRTRMKTGGRKASTNRFALGLVASYEVDLWGRIRASRAAAALEVRATREDVDATALFLASQVAVTWVRLVDQRGQIALLDQQIKTNEDQLGLLRAKRRQGDETVTATDVLQQEQLVESRRAEELQAESDRDVLMHLLAVLLGLPPAEKVGSQAATLPALPPSPSTGLPAGLIQRRPDVRAAFLRLQEAHKDVAAAVADRLPRLSLSASAEGSGGQVHDLFDSWLASIAANLTAPILDGGRRSAEADRTRAVAAERLHRYRDVVLEALREVEDALVQERQQQRLLASLDEQIKLAEKVVTSAHLLVARGETYLRVLTAVQSLQRLQRERLRAQRQLLEFRIDLYRALGGGWPMTRPAPAAAGDGQRSER